MKTKLAPAAEARLALLAIAACSLTIVGCSSHKPEPEKVHYRGWIGGEYKSVSILPADSKKTQKSALLITALSTNTPSYAAGLRPGDLILAVDQQPATSVRNFRRMFDNRQPGSALRVSAWHDAQTSEFNVRVGRETFTSSFVFMMSIPPIVRAFTLWPHEGFSLGVVGYELEPVAERKELGSVEPMYRQAYDSKNFRLSDEGWKAWLVIFQTETFKTIKSQEIVAAQ